jgi:hypothetical protein
MRIAAEPSGDLPVDRPPDEGTITPLLANEFGRRMMGAWLS